MFEKFEAVFILKDYDSEEKIKEIMDKVNQIIIMAGCTILSKQDLGVKKLAYQINKEETAHYYQLDFQNTVSKNNPERKISVEANTVEEILKFIIIRKD